MNAWKPKTGARVVSGCQVALIPATEEPGIDGTTDGVALKAVGRLHARWIIDVWARGIALVDDAYVVELVEARSVDDLDVLATRWEPASPGKWVAAKRPAHVRRDPVSGGEWRLTWEETA